MRPFRSRGGALVASFEEAEVTILGLLLDQLEQLLSAEDADTRGDAVLARLLPEGHRGDPRLAADFRELTEDALRTGKTDDLATVRATLPPDGGQLRLDPEQAGAWLRTTNDLRLALGTRLGITDETDWEDADPASETGQQMAVYQWLTAVQGSLVDALAADRAGRR
jgi:hypothetical protein